jgi:hypothetical protein
MEDATLDDLIQMGVYEVSGVDEQGEPMYSLNVETAKALAPQIYWADRNACETAIFDAVECGYLEWDIDPDTLEMSFFVTELGESVID